MDHHIDCPAMADPPIPALPLDLERHIFELIALSRPTLIPNLMRVAWRVKHWLEPLLYRTLVFGTTHIVNGIPRCHPETFKRIVQPKPASFLRDSVRNLMIYKVPDEQFDTILSACAGVENLWLFTIVSSSDIARVAVESTLLRRLYCHFHFLSSCIAVESLAHPIVRDITHLELFDTSPNAGDNLKALTGLAQLTHLSLATATSLQLCPRLLNACKSLRALVVLDFPPTNFPLAELAIIGRDPRFVMMPLHNHIEHWQRGVLTGRDYWARADAFIRKRMSRGIERNTFVLNEYLEEDAAS
ncbi:hypothetical protein DFH09DRAFT_1191855 [Mycena vulgaris]|nr:hypothetical protein DFH09DRAFT_1191855 [Mycena vulgaris]